MSGPLRHEALIYDSDEALLQTAVPFLRDGVEAGEPALLGVDAPRRALVLDALDGDADGVLVLDPSQYAEPYTAIRRNRDLYTSLLAQGASRLRVIGAVPADPEAWHGWSRYEAIMNRFVRDLPVQALCLYDARETTDAVLDDVALTHTHLRTPDGPQANQRYVEPGLFLAGRPRPAAVPDDDTPPHLELHDPTPAFARRAVLALAPTSGLGAEATQGLGLAVAEVMTNATDHGRAPVSLRAWLGPRSVAVTVRDAGPGPDDPCVGLLPGTAERSDALGLHLAHQTVAELTLEATAAGFAVHLVGRDR